MKREVLVCDNQSKIHVPPAWLVALEKAGLAAASYINDEYLLDDEAPLGDLDLVEVALVDDDESDRVHRDFMGIDGPTDVITFEHGEIVIGLEVAKRQAADYEEPTLRELFRYLVHGLLHLAGYDDQTDEDRQNMEEVQEKLVKRYWSLIEGSSK